VAKEIQHDLDLGIDVFAKDKEDKDTLTLLAFYTIFYLPHIKQNNRSWQTTKSVFDGHILPRWKDLKLNQITRLMMTLRNVG